MWINTNHLPRARIHLATTNKALSCEGSHLNFTYKQGMSFIYESENVVIFWRWSLQWIFIAENMCRLHVKCLLHCPLKIDIEVSSTRNTGHIVYFLTSYKTSLQIAENITWSFWFYQSFKHCYLPLYVIYHCMQHCHQLKR